jgi:C1A family cysteine protease
MFKLVVVGIVALTAFASHHPINGDIVADIKTKATTWVPHEVNENPLAGKTHDELKALLGLHFTYTESPFLPISDSDEELSAPASFDSRTHWPGSVGAIRDQQSCGSCWAFGATEALSDRFRIASGNQVNVVLSPEDMVSCDTANLGCNGGYLDRAWSFLQRTGAVTENCFPYTAGSGHAPACRKTCVDGSAYKKF